MSNRGLTFIVLIIVLLLFLHFVEKYFVENHFCGAYWKTRATGYLSGLADERYRCLNIFLALPPTTSRAHL